LYNLLILRFKFRPALAAALVLGALLITPSALSAFQEPAEKKSDSPQTPRKDDGKVPSAKELEKEKKKQSQAGKDAPKLSQAEALAELALLAYGGRKQMELVRAAIQEQGIIRLATDQGDITGSYNMRSIRKEKSWLDLLRQDLELTPPESVQRQGAPVIKYVIGYNGASVWSAQNNQYVNPRPEAERAFRAQLTHDYTTLLRYKEDGSKLEYIGPETVVGVDTNVLELTTTTGEKTRYWISTKTFRILHLEYDLTLIDGQPPVKYRVSFVYTPLKVVQNTLVPARRVMTQDGKFTQEITLTNAVYSAKLDPEIFQHLQEQ
jgi:hypothetical protein